MADDSNEIGGKVGLDISDFKANVAELNRQIKIIDTGFKAAAAGMDDWGSSEEGLKQKIDALNKITDLQKDKVKNLTDMYTKIAAEKGENSKAAQDLQVKINNETAALNKNLKELNDVTSKLDNFGKEANQAGKQINNMAKSSEDAGVSIKGMTTAILKADVIKEIAKSALEAAKSLIGFANDSQKAMNKFQVSTGYTTEQMKEFKDIAKQIYADNFGESLEDIASSMAVVNQVTMETGEELKKTTEQALLLRDAFGFEVSESINTVQGLMQNFGITSEQAYTLIAQGAQMGANKNGDLLDILNEYGVQFSKLGLSADNFVRILIEGAAQGAFQIDKVGDAVKEFAIRSVDGSKTTSEGFQLIGLNANQTAKDISKGGDTAKKAFEKTVEALLAMKDPLKQQQAGVDLFGTQFEDLGVKGLEALTGIGDGASMVADTLEQMNNVQYNDLDSALEGVKRKILTSFSPTSDVITNMLSGIVNGLNTGDWSLVTSSIINNLNIVFQQITAGIATLPNIALQIITTLVQGIFENLPSLIDAAVNMIVSLIQGLLDSLPKILEQAPKIIDTLLIGITNSLPKLVDGAIKIINTLVNYISNNLGTIVQAAVTIIISLIAGLIKAIPLILAEMPKIIGAILGAFENIDWINIGKQIVAGVASGIINSGGLIIDAAKKAAKSAVYTMTHLLDINSPSRVMRDQVGFNIGAGVAVGIDNSTKEVNRAMSRLNDKIVAGGSVAVDTSVQSANSASTSNSSSSGNQSYGNDSGVFVIQVPVNIDGQTVAQVEAPYSNKIQGSNLAFSGRSRGV